MSLIELSEWLYNTPVSQFIQKTPGVIPAVQSIHIVSISILLGSSIVLYLKIAGIIARTDSSAAVFDRYMPWIWWALLALLLTGLLMVIGEPERVLTNSIFLTKMALIAAAVTIALTIRAFIMRTDDKYQSGARSLFIKALGIIAIAIWIFIIFCGRWIAYAI